MHALTASTCSVMANAESSSSSPNCFFCATPLPISWQRRILERTAPELNRKVSDFLEVFITVGCLTADGMRRNVCKPCFTRVDKARRQVEASEKSINELRAMSRTDLPLVKLIALTVIRSSLQIPKPTVVRSVVFVLVQRGILLILWIL